MRRNLRGSSATAAGLRLALVGLAVAALPAPAQIAADSPPPDTGPLARFVPQENLALLIEFSGIEQHVDAWTNSATYKILNDTSTGEMLSELVARAVHMVTAANPERRIGGDEALELIRHIGRHGAVLGVTGPIAGYEGDSHAVIVIREAATKEARPLFGRLIAEIMTPEGKPVASERGKRRIVEYTPVVGAERRAWWAEGGHLFLAPPRSLDAIFAVLDGDLPSAADHPARNELAATEGGFEPVGWIFADMERLPADAISPDNREALQKLGLSSLKRFDYRWGFEGEAMMGVARFAAPRPRSGVLALMDQPTFDVGHLPPLPSGVDSFTVLSLDALPFYDQFTKLAADLDPSARSRFEDIERQVRDTVRRDLRQQILATIGPRAALYFPPDTRPSGGRLNPLALAASLSVQAPKATLLVELKDPKEFSRSLDEIMIQVNRILEEQTPALAAAAGAGAPPPPTGGREAEAPQPARFRLVSPEPKIYILQLPRQLGAVLNLGLTVAVGKKHLIVSTTTESAREALALEDANKGLWSPSGTLASTFGQLPGTLTMLQVSDSSDTLPNALANLPTTVQTVMAGITAAREAADQAREGGLAAGGGLAGPGPAGPGPAGGPGGRRLMAAAPGGGGGPGQSSGAYGGIPPTGEFDEGEPGFDPQSSGAYGGLGPPGGMGGSSAMMAGQGGGPGGPGGPQAGRADAGPATIQLDPAKAPRAEDIRRLMFPGSMAVSVDEQTVQVVTRTAFPNILSQSSAISAALLLPAIQAARDAARRAAEGAGITTGLPGLGSGGLILLGEGWPLMPDADSASLPTTAGDGPEGHALDGDFGL